MGYKIKCDKHSFQEPDYCEMCWMRSYVQEAVEEFRNDAKNILGQTHLSISVLNDCFFKLEKRINEIEKRIGDMNHEEE